MNSHTTSLALSESGKGLAEVDRELLRRAGVVKPGEDKGAR